MSASKEAIKQLKVKTGTVTRCACAPIVLQRTAKGSAGGTAARALSLVQPKLVAAGKSRPDRTQRLPFFSVAYRALPSRADGARCPRWIGRCLKDLAYTDKEIKSQLERIEKVRQDPEKDEHDVRKQEEVLAEYTTAKPFEQGQLHGYFTALEEKVLEALEDDDLKATEEFSKGVDALNAAAPVLIECGKLEQEDWDATLAQLPAVATPPPPAPA